MNDTEALERRLRASRTAPETEPPALAPAALAAGLIDVAYFRHDSPVGPLLLAATARGLVRVGYLEDDEEAVLSELSQRISPRILRAPGRLDVTRRELDEFFSGERERFDVPLDLRLMHAGFRRRVLQATARIPYGSVSSYKLIAQAAGSPGAFRAAGSALGGNPLPIVIPCHRVLHSGGGLGGYTGGLERKRTLLAVEAGGA